MKYYNLNPNWMEIWGVEVLTDKQRRVQGFLKPIGNSVLECDEKRRINDYRRLSDDRKETKES